jgi:UDP-hydrolysing UDP-N-acetyl-D-glucosamine 2-epimerase
VDAIRSLSLLSKEALEASVGFSLDSPVALVTFHPVTLDGDATPAEQFGVLLNALRRKPELRCLFTYPNSDTDGRIIIDMIHKFVAENSHRAFCVPSLGQLRYLSALQYVDVVLGNSSSGIVEVPGFGIPTVNIGIRQKGRIRATSVIDCPTTENDILSALDEALSDRFRAVASQTVNPYHKPDTAQNILHVLKTADLSKIILKRFYDIPLR